MNSANLARWASDIKGCSVGGAGFAGITRPPFRVQPNSAQAVNNMVTASNTTVHKLFRYTLVL